MYNQSITLFNYDAEEDDYLKTFIKGVEFQPNYQTIPKVDKTDSDTSALIIIEYFRDDIGKYIYSEGNKIYYASPKTWSLKSQKFTIQNNTDFIIIGNYMDIVEVNLNEIKNSIDNVFIINQFKDFMDELRHFEIYVN